VKAIAYRRAGIACDRMNKGASITDKVGPNPHPFISVLMPVHNSARFLRQAIESVLAETYSNFEFLLYDDMSADDSSKMMAEYADRDPRIRIYQGRQKAPSIPFILKLLVRESKGEYFTIHDSDDISLPDRLQCLVNKAVKNPSASIVFGWHRMVDEKCANTLQIFGEPIWPFKYFLDGFVHAGASLISKKYYGLTEGFNEGIRWSADRDLYFKMLERAPFSHIGKVIYIYRRHMGSWTFKRPNDYDALSIVREEAVKRNIPIVQGYLEKGRATLTYNEYVALNYEMASLAMEVLGEYRNSVAAFEGLAKRLGIGYRSFQSLRHDIPLAEVRNIDELRHLIRDQIEQVRSRQARSLSQIYYHTRGTLFRKAKRILSMLRNQDE